MKKTSLVSSFYLITCLISIAHAQFTITFSGEENNNIGSPTLDFTIDGSGNVAMDASTSAPDSGNLASVNAWDGVVGFTSDASLHNTSFSLIGSTNTTAFHLSGSQDPGVETGLGLQGSGKSLISGAGSQVMTWTLSTSDEVSLQLTSFSSAAVAGSGESALVFTTAETSVTYGKSELFDGLNFPDVDTSLDNILLSTSGDTLDINTPVGAGGGASLYSMTFDFVAVPEPSTYPFIGGLIALGFAMNRRRKK
ncbi:MAG: PEP-CTERM sorting domain-containing protein [Opitutales bacterium]